MYLVIIFLKLKHGDYNPCKFSQDGRILLSIIFVLGIEMKHLKNNKKKNNEIVITTTTLFTIATILVFATIVIPSSQQLAYARLPGFSAGREVPPAITGDNIYIAWWTNNTENGNEEVMFRASTDGGATFGDKMNLSNTPDADSTRVEIAGEGANVVVTWWKQIRQVTYQ